MIVTDSKVEEGTQALLKVLETDKLSQSKPLLAAAAPVFLQIDFVKIPKIKKRVVRIPLENSLLTGTSDVCLLVSDLIRGRKVNHELTLNHYNKLLKKRGVTDVQKLQVMSSRQIRVDYAQFEAKKKLCNMFDVFLIDNKISNYLRPKLGKEFHKARKWPIPIRMKRKNLKEEILSKLQKTSMALDGCGTTKTVQVGRVDMSSSEISQNIIAVCKYISEHFPGGWINIRSLHIKGLRSIAVPIYMSLIPRNDVPTPTIKTKRRKRILASQELSTVGKKVTVYRSGRVKVHKRKRVDDSDSDEDTPPPIDDTCNKAVKINDTKQNSSKKAKLEDVKHNSASVPKTKKKIKNTDKEKSKAHDDTAKKTTTVTKKSKTSNKNTVSAITTERKDKTSNENTVSTIGLDEDMKKDTQSKSIKKKRKERESTEKLEKDAEHNDSMMSPAKKQKRKKTMEPKTEVEPSIPPSLKPKKRKNNNDSVESKLTKDGVSSNLKSKKKKNNDSIESELTKHGVSSKKKSKLISR